MQERETSEKDTPFFLNHREGFTDGDSFKQQCGPKAVIVGGATTKLHVAADAHGNPIDFEVTGGEVHDAKAADKIITKIGSAENFIADKGYDSETIRGQARAAGMTPIIPRKSNSDKPNPEFDSHLYGLRHLKLKHYRSIATRYEKLARNFKAMVLLACTLIWLKLK